MKLRIAVLAILICLSAGSISARKNNYSRRLPSQRREAKATPSGAQVEVYDTVAGADSIVVSGYDKILRSVREAMFVTNRGSRDVGGLTITVSYLDSSQRLLHRASHTVHCDIPAGETRRIEIPSFDRQQIFYYRLSPAPRKATQATPFDVKVSVDAVFHPITPPSEQ